MNAFPFRSNKYILKIGFNIIRFVVVVVISELTCSIRKQALLGDIVGVLFKRESCSNQRVVAMQGKSDAR